ncbi:hypothetical protein [Chryseobacterium gambrini]|uniref:Uncharacterized protein n=1 Tax=Chryseobacterium gambrini TaxID=373672 RepID=A0A1N7MJN4_9FLAO|nr:hypothetical protein [Chryseobacterium gambrini]SIS86222.1 hypothetical protein SAMN05421785_103272 [Chryseobacterium gambrini]
MENSNSYENSALALDSIYNVLSWYDRVSLHSYMHGGSLVTKKATQLLKFVKTHEWYPPKMRYTQNNVLEYYEPKQESWLKIAQYMKNHPKLTVQIQEYLN